jgi:hypothetical protein
MYGRLVTQDQMVALAAQPGSTAAAQKTAAQVMATDLGVTMTSAGTQAPRLLKYREPNTAPLRKLSVDLIKTYKHINEVSILNVSSSDHQYHFPKVILKFSNRLAIFKSCLN